MAKPSSRSPSIDFDRADGTCGRAPRNECDRWTQRRFSSFDLSTDVHRIARVYTNPKKLRRIEPSLFFWRIKREWFRRVPWHEQPRAAATVYVGVTEDWAHAWLLENGYEIPTAARPKKKYGAKKTALLRILWDSFGRGEDSPKLKELTTKGFVAETIYAASSELQGSPEYQQSQWVKDHPGETWGISRKKRRRHQ